MTMWLDARIRQRALLAVLAMACAGGCVTDRTSVVSRKVILDDPQPEHARKISAGNDGSPPVSRMITTNQARMSITALGSIPFDGFTLPLASPAATHIATSTGYRPRWDDVLAGDGARPPMATRIQVWRLAPGGYELIHTLPGGHVLGRSATDEGFLVEMPLENGSRWIGMADWKTGQVDWIVDDDRVNAFGVIGPGGQFAWSTREIDREHFELRVRNEHGEWSWQDDPERSWMLPVFSENGQGVFVASFLDGRLHLVHGPTINSDTFDQGKRQLSVSVRATPRTAWQMMLSVGTGTAVQPDSGSTLCYFSPTRRRMSLWNPSVQVNWELLNGSIAACRLEKDSYIVATRTGVYLMPLQSEVREDQARIELLEETSIPYPADRGGQENAWNILLARADDDQLMLSGLWVDRVREEPGED